MNFTPYLPGFKASCGRRRKSSLQKLQEQLGACRKLEIHHLRKLFSPVMSIDLLKKRKRVSNSSQRARIYTTEVTFWAFLVQVLWQNASCAEAVKAVQTWFYDADSGRQISSNTASYAAARLRLSYFKLLAIFHFITQKATVIPPEKLWYGRRVKKIDGTSFQLNDTEENQQEFPQSKAQKKGCGFPRCQVQGLVCLATGLLLDWVETNINVHDSVAWKKLWEFFIPEDIILADRAYGSYINFSLLLKREVDMVTRLNQKRKFSLKDALRRNSKNDIIVKWQKPKKKPRHLSVKEWERIDDELEVRLIKYKVEEPGFRTKEVIIATTLLNFEQLSTQAIIDLYAERWGIEVRFRDIKTTMKMGALKGRTPLMVKKEIIMTAIAYNLTRFLINEALKKKPEISYKRVSFAGALYQIRQWMSRFEGEHSVTELHRLISAFYDSLIDCPVPERLGRNEPRARKQRSKYKILNKKRSEMKVEPHRSKYKKIA